MRIKFSNTALAGTLVTGEDGHGLLIWCGRYSMTVHSSKPLNDMSLGEKDLPDTHYQF